MKSLIVPFRIDGDSFFSYISKQIFDGNSDQTTVVTVYFPTPVNATFIRIRPTDWEGWISMRFDILGCELGEGRHVGSQKN